METPELQAWSAPDARGIRTCLRKGRSLLDARRLRRADGPPRPEAVSPWPAEWRRLLAAWLASPAPKRQWDTLLKQAGNARYVAARDLLTALLENGWIELHERRERNQWILVALHWRDADGLRETLGLPRRDHLAASRAALLDAPPADERLTALHAGLSALPAAQALRRGELLAALERWLEDAREGTRRDFALFARGDTKAIAETEWRWLEGALDLERLGIARHQPALWLRAPLRLGRGETWLDLRVVPDLIGLTPATVAGIEAADGRIGAWRVVENRTSVERVACRYGDRDGVLWVPGFAPDWWLRAFEHLLRLCPAPVQVACDPDPAGIEIALGVGRCCQARGIAWTPWHMDAAALAALPQRKPLTEHDHERLRLLRARPLPAALADLAQAMLERGQKGEQEGLDLGTPVDQQR